jgi:NADH dehydrogenase FAD-containing subunit
VVIPARVTALHGPTARFSDGTARDFDLVLAATGARPPGLFTACGLSADPGGGLTVSACLQSPWHPELFGGGDCVHFGPTPLPRAGVYAVRQGPVLAANLLAFLSGGRLTPFCDTGKNYLALVNCGDGRAILRKGPFVAEGVWAMALKDWIDRRFMQSFPLGPQPPGR